MGAKDLKNGWLNSYEVVSQASKEERPGLYLDMGKYYCQSGERQAGSSYQCSIQSLCLETMASEQTTQFIALRSEKANAIFIV